MIVNKSMYPLQTGFGVISKMQGTFAKLQMQLGTGEKANKLSEMGRDLPLSLSVRQRLGRIEGFSANIDTVNLRLSFLNNTLTRLDKMEGEARNSAMPGQYGTNNINMATLPDLSKARLDELVTLLNAEVAGRHLFGGSNTDVPPLPNTDILLNGQAGKAGYKAVVAERNLADTGTDGLGRLTAAVSGTPATTVTLAEDGAHPFGFKISTSSVSPVGKININTAPVPVQQTPGGPDLGNQVVIDFVGPDPISEGQTITIGLTLPDGTATQVTMRAVAAENSMGSSDEFIIGEDFEETAANFQNKLGVALKRVADSELVAASTFAASNNYFNGAGEPVLRVDGNPATATALKVGTERDTVMWYGGQSPAVAAANMGRLGIETTASDATTPASVSLNQSIPPSAAHGFQIVGISANTASMTTSVTTTAPATLSVSFDNGVPENPPDPAVPPVLTLPGEVVEVSLAEPAPSNKVHVVKLTAVVGRAAPGQFTVGTTPDETAANFAAALKLSVTEAAMTAEGNPRQSVSAQVDENTRASYGMQANESGLLRMVRTMAAMTVSTYANDDESSRLRFDAMATRQASEMSEGHNAERGSIEILTMELSVAMSSINSASKRHQSYQAQLENLLGEIETINKEEVAMQIMALQTRLQASYQATSMVSKLSLVNYM
jgi:flagellar hook-associated protein 3 FlgL